MYLKTKSSEKTIHSKASFMLLGKTPEELADKYNTDFDENGEFYLNIRTAGLRAYFWFDKKGNQHFNHRETKERMVAEDFESIPLNQCRKCKQINNPYDRLYFRYDGSAGMMVNRTLYCHENGYCESCAKWYEEHPINGLDLRVVDEYKEQLIGDDYPTYIRVFSDGSIEEHNESYARRNNL